MTALLNFALILLIIVIVVVMGSIVGAWHFNAEADAVLRSDFNASPIIEITNTVGIEEYRRGQTAPILNPGKPILPCPECANYVLTDYRRSPTVFGPNGLYKGHFRGDVFIFDTPPTMENLFQKTPSEGGQ
jgi:hypothetical protein